MTQVTLINTAHKNPNKQLTVWTTVFPSPKLANTNHHTWFPPSENLANPNLYTS